MSIGAIIHLSQEDSYSLLLEDLLFSPAALWLSQALLTAGVDDFLVVCPPAMKEPLALSFPPQTQFLHPNGQAEDERDFRAFLSHDTVLILTAPLLLSGMDLVFLPTGQTQSPSTGLYRISGSLLTKTLGNHSSLQDALLQHGQEASQNCALLLQSTDPALWQMYQGQAHLLEIRRFHAMGVRFIDPSTFYSCPTVTVGKGTRILPHTILKGSTTIGSHCTLGPNTMIENATLGNHITVNTAQIYDSTVEDGATIGPFAYIRPHCHIGSQVKVGDFVEVKNATIGQGSKIPHLSYVGDADVGSNVNFGCGSLLVNYNGAEKFRSTIHDNAFIGCNTNLVSPVTLGKGAYTAAGSTITQDVPENNLAIARERQTNKMHWNKPQKSK